MNLLSARTTATSYPTDVALEKRYFVPGIPVGRLVECQLVATGTFGTTPVAGVEYSIDDGTNWASHDSFTVVNDEPSLPFRIPNGARVRPTLTVGAGDSSITLAFMP